MLKQGYMRPLKRVLGILLLVAGAGLIAIPNTIVPILCDNKIIFGAVVAVAGYFLFISGRRI